MARQAGSRRAPEGRRAFERAPVPHLPDTNLTTTMPVGASELVTRSGPGAGRRTQPPSPTSDKVPRPPSSQVALRPLQTCAGRAVPRSRTRSPQEGGCCLRASRGICFSGGDACARVLSVIPLSLYLFVLSPPPKGIWLVTLGGLGRFLRSKLRKGRRRARAKLSVHRWETVLPSRGPKDLGQKLLGFLPYLFPVAPFQPMGERSPRGDLNPKVTSLESHQTFFAHSKHFPTHQIAENSKEQA